MFNYFRRMLISILSGQSTLRIMPLASGRIFYDSWWFPIIFGASFSPQKKIGEDYFKLERYVSGEEEPPNWLESNKFAQINWEHLELIGPFFQMLGEQSTNYIPPKTHIMAGT